MSGRWANPPTRPRDRSGCATRTCAPWPRTSRTPASLPVIDVVVPDLANLDGFRSALGDRLRLVVSTPGPTSASSRNATRPPIEQFFFDGYDGLHATMQTGFGGLGWWLDTSAQTSDETVEQLLTHADERARVEPLATLRT